MGSTYTVKLVDAPLTGAITVGGVTQDAAVIAQSKGSKGGNGGNNPPPTPPPERSAP